MHIDSRKADVARNLTIGGDKLNFVNTLNILATLLVTTGQMRQI